MAEWRCSRDSVLFIRPQCDAFRSYCRNFRTIRDPLVCKSLLTLSRPHMTMHPPCDRPPAAVVVFAAVLATSSITSFMSSPVRAEHSA